MDDLPDQLRLGLIELGRQRDQFVLPHLQQLPAHRRVESLYLRCLRRERGFTLPAGEYELAWISGRVKFTVPAGASVKLTWRDQPGGSSEAVFSLDDGSEMVVPADVLSRASGAAAADDPTLAAIAASLRDPAGDAAETTARTTVQHSASEQSEGGGLRVDLAADGCAYLAQGGQMTISLCGGSLTVALDDTRQWLVADGTWLHSGGAGAVVFLAGPSGGYLALDIADGREVARYVPDGQHQLGAVFDALAVGATSGSPGG